VEVSADGGRTWKDAQLQSAVHRYAHTRFGMSWNWDGRECVLMSRCRDEKGQLQPTVEEFNRMWQAESRGEAHPNFIMPWKLNRDGTIQNGLS
jgi:sulfane dehydrogenase subunit SoxC